MDLAVGTVVANTYEILGPLGRGGMGELFRARNTRTERRVALKLLRADNKHRVDAIERFRREARAAGMINSDHVTQVLDVEDDPRLGIAIAFELLEGESLLERLRRTGPMDVETVYPIVEQILRGLGDAHRVDIIHRDLKPSNVFLEKRPDGTQRVKILDFGISKLPKQIAKTTLTEPGQSLGSFMFMPPEQIQRAAAVDARADIYAVGTLVFQAMTGHLPYSARNMVELVTQKTSGQPRTMSQASGKPFSPILEQWVGRCLKLAPNDRFQTAQEASAAWAQIRGNDLTSSSDRGAASPRAGQSGSQPLPAGYQPLPPSRSSGAQPAMPVPGGQTVRQPAPPQHAQNNPYGAPTPGQGQMRPSAADLKGRTIPIGDAPPEVIAARQAVMQAHQQREMAAAGYGPPPGQQQQPQHQQPQQQQYQQQYQQPPQQQQQPIQQGQQQAPQMYAPQSYAQPPGSGAYPAQPHPLSGSGARPAQQPPPSSGKLAPTNDGPVAKPRGVPVWLVILAVVMVVAALGVSAAVVYTLMGT